MAIAGGFASVILFLTRQVAKFYAITLFECKLIEGLFQVSDGGRPKDSNDPYNKLDETANDSQGTSTFNILW